MLAQQGWRCSLLHNCSERRYPSRDQRTSVNPLLKILVNPLGLLRLEVDTVYATNLELGNERLSMVHQLDTPSRHMCSIDWKKITDVGSVTSPIGDLWTPVLKPRVCILTVLILVFWSQKSLTRGWT